MPQKPNRHRCGLLPMIYQVSPSFNAYGMVEYDQDHSPPYDLFCEGTSLKRMALDLRYTVKKKIDVDKLAKAHLLNLIGPNLVRDALRSVIERVAPGQAEFFDIRLSCKGTDIPGFSAINLVHRVPCVDMEKSEYSVTNFDPQNPSYMFLYTVLRDCFEDDLEIARCAEARPAIVVGEALKAACFDAQLHGILFYRALDLTPADRSICERS